MTRIRKIRTSFYSFHIHNFLKKSNNQSKNKLSHNYISAYLSNELHIESVLTNSTGKRIFNLGPERSLPARQTNGYIMALV